MIGCRTVEFQAVRASRGKGSVKVAQKLSLSPEELTERKRCAKLLSHLLRRKITPSLMTRVAYVLLGDACDDVSSTRSSKAVALKDAICRARAREVRATSVAGAKPSSFPANPVPREWPEINFRMESMQ